MAWSASPPESWLARRDAYVSDETRGPLWGPCGPCSGCHTPFRIGRGEGSGARHRGGEVVWKKPRVNPDPPEFVICEDGIWRPEVQSNSRGLLNFREACWPNCMYDFLREYELEMGQLAVLREDRDEDSHDRATEGSECLGDTFDSAPLRRNSCWMEGPMERCLLTFLPP